MTALALLCWVSAGTTAIILLNVAVLSAFGVIRAVRKKTVDADLNLRPGSQHTVQGSPYVVRNLVTRSGQQVGQNRTLTVELEALTRKTIANHDVRRG